MLKLSLLSSISIALLGLTGVAKATVTATVCNGCGPAALRQEALDEGNGDHYLYDFINHKLTHYSIAGQTPLMTFKGLILPQRSTYITQVPINQATQTLFNAVQDFYVANGNSVYATTTGKVNVNTSLQPAAITMSSIGPTPMADGSGYMTAFDMVQIPAYRQAAINTQTNFSNFDAYPNVIRAAAGTVLSSVNYVPLVKVPIMMLITLSFPDGSTSVISYNFTSQAFEYVEGSSKDAVGNPIPETPLEASGGGSKTYVFPATLPGLAAGSAQILNMQKMGINIPTTVFSSSWTIACSNIVGTLPHCVAQPL